MATLTVGRSTGRMAPMEVESLDDLTVEAVLRQAEMPLRMGESVAVNGKPVDPRYNHLREGDRIMVTEPVEGAAA